MTRYTVSSDPMGYGEECVDGVKCAEAVMAQLKSYISANGLYARVAIVPEKRSICNYSAGDLDVIAELDDLVEKNWIDWIPGKSAKLAGFEDGELFVELVNRGYRLRYEDGKRVR